MAAEPAEITPNHEPFTGSDRQLLEHILADLHDIALKVEKWERIAGRIFDNPAAKWRRRAVPEDS